MQEACLIISFGPVFLVYVSQSISKFVTPPPPWALLWTPLVLHTRHGPPPQKTLNPPLPVYTVRLVMYRSARSYAVCSKTSIAAESLVTLML